MITICNYDTFQGQDNRGSQSKANERPTKVQREATIEKGKKERTEKHSSSADNRARENDPGMWSDEDLKTYGGVDEEIAELRNSPIWKEKVFMDDGQTESLAYLLAQEYRDMKYSVMQLFFFRFKCGDFGKFYGKVDPMVITCALKDFVNKCDMKRQKFLNEEYEERSAEKIHSVVFYSIAMSLSEREDTV